MKLEKREITLNEKDSLKDMYFLEKNLQTQYEQGVKFAERKETEGELSALMREAERDAALCAELIACAPDDFGGKKRG